jgi:hypothetical protein
MAPWVVLAVLGAGFELLPGAESLSGAIESLPPALRDVPGGPLEIELHPEPSAYGMGDGSPERPEWTSGLRRFHLYAYRDGGEDRADLNTRHLSAPRREALWRRRALVHAVIRRWDAALGWSDRPDFRRLSGWVRPFERGPALADAPLNVFAGAFSRGRGQASAALDLATFAEEALVPAPLPEDDAVPCQEPSKWRFLMGRLVEQGLVPAPPEARCPAFEAWADEPSLEAVEVLLVAATGRAVESLFGHVMLRLQRSGGARVAGPSFQTAVQLVALTGAEQPGLEYAVRGLTGGYQIAVLTTSFGDLRRELLEDEQRGIRRFRLNLTATERRRALERIWELERTGYARYFFFGHNCATALLDLVEAVLEGGRRVPRPGFLVPLTPSGALDALAGVTAGDRPLLEPVPGELESTQLAALRSEALRAEALRDLELAGALDPAERKRLAAVDALLRAGDPLRRARGYRQLAALLDRVLPGAAAGAREAAYAYFLHSVRVERYAQDAALARRKEIQIGALALGDVRLPTGADELRWRQRTFRSQAALAGAPAVLDRRAAIEDALLQAPKRAYLPEEERELTRTARAVATFRLATDLHAQVVDRHFSDVNATERLQADEAARIDDERQAAADAPAHSGVLRTWVEAGARRERTLLGPSVVLGSALLSERLGERRLHGFRPWTEVQIGAGWMELGLSPSGMPRIVASQLTLVGFRTLLRDVEVERRTILDHLGWGFSTGTETGGGGSRGRGHVELLAVLDEGDGWRRYTALGLGPAVSIAWEPELLGQAGLHASLTSRIPLLGGGALRVEAEAEALLGWNRPLATRANLELEVELTAARLGRRSLVLGPALRAAWGRAAQPELRAGLRAELR